GALIYAKEEQLVLYDRHAERSTKLVSLQRVPFRRKEVSRVKNSIPYKFKRIAMKVVRTRLGDDVHIRRCVHAILRLQRAGFDFEFLYGVRERQRQIQADVGIIMRSTVEVICRPVRNPAAHRNHHSRILSYRVQTATA